MPPKRKSTGSNGPAQKRAKPAAAITEPVYVPPRGKRWSAVSGSANAEGDYRMGWKDEERAYSYITLCSAFYTQSDDEDDDEDDDDSDSDDGESRNGDESDDEKEEDDEGDDDEEEEDNDDGAERRGPPCGKKRCLCFKPLASNPEHPWVISWAGFRKFNNQFTHAFLRDPDNFSMYTFNDHAAHGSMQILQNLFLDFEEAAQEKRGEWREQWAICECVVHWLLCSGSDGLSFIDDCDGVHAIMRLVGRMFLAMLGQLDGLGLVGDATAVKSLGCTMAMYMVLASTMRARNIINEEPREEYTSEMKFQPDYFEDAILTYANKRGVTLCGPEDIEELMAQAVGTVELPEKKDPNPWGWKAELKKYVKNHGISKSSRGAPKIGGDCYDITTWSSAERKASSFNKKDPFSKKELDSLKAGMVLGPA
ncbi:hypothetical protein GQX73_g5074 [Xylaria multiplex]|uniref:Uncharacterized protein n=1 Tax=Xylaria multiplex TaxID=323545 RepID=A0A7C8MTW4_9PEZI|nr:hypothetical protein GQX73_g5074 [Xylaria multiplex]